MTTGSHPLSQSLSERSEVSCSPGEPESSCRGAASGPPHTYTVVSRAGGISVGKGGVLRAGPFPVTPVAAWACH